MVLFNGDDPELVQVIDRHTGPARSFGMKAGHDVVIHRVRADAFRHMDVRIQVGGDSIRANLPFVGRHYLYNVAAAVCAAHALGLDKGELQDGLAQLRPLGQRGRVETLLLSGGRSVQVMDESYNSNPAALSSVLSDVAEMGWSGRKVAVLGDMLELGQATSALHRQVGQEVARCGIDLLVTVGDLATELAAGAIEAGMHVDAIIRAHDARDAAQVVVSRLEEDDFILVKASRGVGLERVVRNLRQLSEGESE